MVERPTGVLRVSLPVDFATFYLTPIIVDFARHYPGITFEFDLTPRRVDLVADPFDVAIRMGKLEDSSLIARHRQAGRPGRDSWARPATPWLSTNRCVRCLPFYARFPVPTSVFAAPEDWSAPELGSRIDRAATELTQFLLSRVGNAITDAAWQAISTSSEAMPGERNGQQQMWISILTLCGSRQVEHSGRTSLRGIDRLAIAVLWPR